MTILDTTVPVPRPRPSGPTSSSRPHGRWFIEVAIRNPDKPWSQPTRYLLGPVGVQGGWSRALEIARAWETEFGPKTTRLQFRSSDDARLAGRR